MYAVHLYFYDANSYNTLLETDEWYFRNKKKAKKFYQALSKFYDDLGDDKPFWIKDNRYLDAVTKLRYEVFLFNVDPQDDEIEKLVFSAIENGGQYY